MADLGQAEELHVNELLQRVLEAAAGAEREGARMAIGEARQALAEQTRSVRIPLNQNSHLIKLSRAETILAQVLKRDPTDAEIARLVDETPESVRASRQMSGIEISFDAPVDRSDRDASTLGERFADADGDARVVNRVVVDD